MTRISVHTMLRCVCKNWHCARVTRPQPARYRATRGPSTSPRRPPKIPPTGSLFLSLPATLSLSLSLSSFAITRHPCSRPLPCSAAFVALRSPCHPSPDNVSPFSFFPFLVFFFFGFLHSCTFFFRPTDWAPLSCADRAFLNYARFMRGQRAFALGSVEWRDSDKGTSTSVKGESRWLRLNLCPPDND